VLLDLQDLCRDRDGDFGGSFATHAGYSDRADQLPDSIGRHANPSQPANEADTFDLRPIQAHSSEIRPGLRRRDDVEVDLTSYRTD
jgi:hypothetical protein